MAWNLSLPMVQNWTFTTAYCYLSLTYRPNKKTDQSAFMKWTCNYFIWVADNWALNSEDFQFRTNQTCRVFIERLMLPGKNLLVSY